MAFSRTTPGLDLNLGLYGRGVLLRPPIAADYSAWMELRGSSRAHLIPYEPQWAVDELARTAYRRRLRRYADDMAADHGYAFFIFGQRDMALLGGLTLSNVRRGVAQSASVGYWMGQRHAGQGHMSAALKTVLPFAFGDLHLHRLEAACLPHNHASVRVLAKTGFEREGLARGYLKIDGVWQDHLLFGLTSDVIVRGAQ